MLSGLLTLLAVLAPAVIASSRAHFAPQYPSQKHPLGASFDDKAQTFRLDSARSTYSFCITNGEILQHLHYGDRLGSLSNTEPISRLMNTVPVSFDAGVKNSIGNEWADYGTGDYRRPSFQIVNPYDGSLVTPLKYISHSIFPGKPSVAPELPSTFVDDSSQASSLSILLRDEMSGFEVTLWYTVFHQLDIISRRAVFRNVSPKNKEGRNITIISAMSATLDLPPLNWHLTQLSGSWARERHVVSRPIGLGSTVIESRRGASSHQQNPFIVLSDGARSEDSGEHIALALVYSGNFLADIEMVQTGRVRVSMGINPFSFSWNLCAGCEFSTPEVILARSGKGMGPLSRNLHDLVRNHLMPRGWRNFRRPFLVNSWEAMYFDVSYDNVINKIAIPAKELGIPMVVLDDGWFGSRNNDRSGLGDWDVNLDKFPGGLSALTDTLGDMGLDFGIWMEPEMIQRKSRLYETHPEWVLSVNGRAQTESRNQLVLDMTNPDVRNFAFNAIAKTLRSANITYLKWDFNRHLTEPFSRSYSSPVAAFETQHRYVLGLYEVLQRVRAAFPHLHIESCSGGGGRFDFGMLAYSDAVWTSDNTDAVSRARIQYGTSLGYPLITMGAHVSKSPNEQLGRFSSPGSRALVASLGTFGYELDLSALTHPEWVTKWGDRYGTIFEQLIRDGEVWRISDPFDDERGREGKGPRFMAMGVVGRDTETVSKRRIQHGRHHEASPVREAVVVAILTDYFERVWDYPNLRLPFLRFASSESLYSVRMLSTPCGEEGLESDKGESETDLGVYSGRTLASLGVPLRFSCDGQAVLIRTERVVEM